MRSSFKIAFVLLLGVMTLSAQAQVQNIYDRGGNALLRQLQRLQTTASILHTGAHPDDEDSALVAYHARKLNARTAYLSLTRGSGGQNIIGTEQSDALGVIRTEELLQARRLDGAEQLFTRANDFGFSKYRSEASRIWPESVLMGDMVRAIRMFRPTIVVSRWNGTASDGHGHHQFTGYLTPLAIAAAADANQYPEQLASGLSVWQVQKYYTGQRINFASPELPALITNTGEYDPASGRSYFEIGMQGRSQQKTQQMGSLELRGQQWSGLNLEMSQLDSPETEQTILASIDTSITGIAAFEAQASPDFISQLAQLDTVVGKVLSQYNPLNPQALLPALFDGLTLSRAVAAVSQSEDSQRLLKEKEQELESAILLASGISIDALADTETIVPGSTSTVAVRAFIPSGINVAITDVRLLTPRSWTYSPAAGASLANEVGNLRQEQADAELLFNVTAPLEAKLTQPYWLELPRSGAAYDWSTAGDAANQPFANPLLTAEVTLAIDDTAVTVQKEVQFRSLDRIRGEVRRRLDVVPVVSVEPASDLFVIPAAASDKQHELALTLRNNSQQTLEGLAQFEVPQGWVLEPRNEMFSLPPAPATTTINFTVSLPNNVTAGEYKLAASASINSIDYRQAMTEIAYPHIRTHRVYTAAETEFEVVDVEVAQVRVGYIMGSGDTVPEALRRLGVEVDLLSDAYLTTGDLQAFDTIVVGIRASQTRDAYVANNQRLHNYVEQGGSLIVQYQQPDFVGQNLPPFPASMDGNVRVVDETAPITILEPNHPVFTFPNAIESRDFDGWIQERNNYNFTRFDRENYIPLTEAHDEGEADSEGAMLYAKMGKGHYVYTAYSWFRQLPNGVPGAYRLFANLLSLPAAP